jgi:3-hydroxyisobutyrate dehydrogenase-like beta-hydroxyacid dehydrogenase
MTRTSNAERVAVVGMGTMGGGIVRNLLANGVDVVGYDADPDIRRWARDLGAATVDDLAQVGAVARRVILMLPNPDVLGAVVLGEGGLVEALEPGTVVIEMGTDGPGPVRACADALREKGVDLLDSPVGGGGPGAADGTLTLLVGGDDELVERCRWLLDILGGRVIRCGDVGSGQMVKLLNNMIACTNVAVLAEAHLLARRAGIDPAVLGELGSATAADSWQLRNALVERWPAQDFEPGFRLVLARKDLRLGLEFADGYGVGDFIRCASMAYQWYGEAAEDGQGDRDMTAMLLYAEHLAERLTEAGRR